MADKKAKAKEYKTAKNVEKMPVYEERSHAALKDVGLQDVGIDGDPSRRPPNRPDPEVAETRKNVKKQKHYRKVCADRLAAVGLESFSVDPARRKYGEPSPLEGIDLEDE